MCAEDGGFNSVPALPRAVTILAIGEITVPANLRHLRIRASESKALSQMLCQSNPKTSLLQ
ncbi:hypothetical protein [Candidatus Chlorohelix sp.]|uniref:hypothetical protein n=1 Tax=Candidatus Chlorohelix sp. TaxID=3139201 RepID=UPI003047FE68